MDSDLSKVFELLIAKLNADGFGNESLRLM